MFILFSRETVYLTMVSFFTVNLLMNISTIYYTKIIEEDNGNVLKHVFDGDRLPQYDTHIVEKMKGSFLTTHEEVDHKDGKSFKMDASFHSEFAKIKRNETCIEKASMNFYVFIRGIYASLIFYFIPYMYLFVSYFKALKKVQQIEHI